jgi:hypothetical protein
MVHKADAMATVSAARTKFTTVASYTQQTKPASRKESVDQRYTTREQQQQDDWENFDLEMEVTSFQELQRSTGSEILDSNLQLQIDQASKYPNLFLDAHVSDASYMEKVAMASIPEQLPRPAVNALRKTKGLNFATARVSPEEEIELAKMIQRGVKLHKLRSDF